MNMSIKKENSVLIVDDEQAAIDGTLLVLESEGVENILTCSDSREVMNILSDNQVGLVLLDLSMPHIKGQILLDEIRKMYPDVFVIIITGYNDIDSAISCMKAGAFDYLVKPVDETRLVSSVKRAVEYVELKKEYSSFRKRVLDDELESPDNFSKLVTISRKMFSLFQYVETIASTRWPVLITGETGTGKELMAKAVHLSSGQKGPFVSVNVAALDSQMFSDTLFGHVKGAFTGADGNRTGLIEKAKHGTLFLDEIGDLSLDDQVKLLRLFQENEYLPIGADAPKIAHTRIVVATNVSLQQAQKDGKFRSDLYFRLNTHKIEILPLRKRKEDIPVLLDHFTTMASLELGIDVPVLPAELPALLSSFSFPGNVRELKAMIFDGISKQKNGVISVEPFKQYIEENREVEDDICNDNPEQVLTHTMFSNIKTLPSLMECRQILIEEAMTRAKGNQTTASLMLGISRSGLNKALSRK